MEQPITGEVCGCAAIHGAVLRQEQFREPRLARGKQARCPVVDDLCSFLAVLSDCSGTRRLRLRPWFRGLLFHSCCVQCHILPTVWMLLSLRFLCGRPPPPGFHLSEMIFFPRNHFGVLCFLRRSFARLLMVSLLRGLFFHSRTYPRKCPSGEYTHSRGSVGRGSAGMGVI
jgi:hypothetical protein